MKFRDDVIDQGAPQIAAVGPWKVERISAGQIRVSYYTTGDDGPIAAVHVICDHATYTAALALATTLHSTLIELPHGEKAARLRGVAH